MSSKKTKGFSPHLRIILLAVGIVCLFAPAIPGLRRVTMPGNAPVIGTAYAQDAGGVNNGNNDVNNGANGVTNAIGAAGSENVPVGLNDVLHIAVVGQNDLTNDYQVDNNGDITMPYVGKVHVGGMSLDAVAPAVTTKLNAIYNNVQVTVTRRAIGGISITLTGALNRQGTVLVRRDAHLNDVLQQAGLAADADVAHVKVTHGLPGTPQSTDTIDYSQFLTGNSSDTYNPSLKDGDVIYIAHKSPVTVSVSITGDVTAPGRYDMPAGSTFYDLITKAGNLTAHADKNDIYIQPIGTLTHKSVDYDKAVSTPQDNTVNPLLSDGDKIVVAELPSQASYSITGGVVAPGVQQLAGTVTLADAIGAAHGLDPHAHANKTTITRRTPNGATVIHVDAKDPKVAGNFIVQPDDNIYIPPGGGPNALGQVNIIQLAGVLISAYAIFH